MLRQNRDRGAQTHASGDSGDRSEDGPAAYEGSGAGLPGSGERQSGAEKIDRKRRFRLNSGVTTAAAVVAVIGGIVTLLFQVDPGLAPCLSSRQADFTGAPAFPQYPYTQFLADLGHATSGYPNLPGVEVRYSYEAKDLRGQLVGLRATLVSVDRDGNVTNTYPAATADYAVDNIRGQRTFTPDKCSQFGGGVLWILVPDEARRHHLRIILELFAGTGAGNRVALTETPTIAG